MKDQLEALILQMYKSNILYSEGVREFKKRFILTVLQQNKGNQCRAARELGMHRNTLSRTIDELKIDVRQLRDGAKRPPRSARPLPLEKKTRMKAKVIDIMEALKQSLKSSGSRARTKTASHTQQTPRMQSKKAASAARKLKSA